MPIPQNGQTHSNSVFDHFVGLALKGLISDKGYYVKLLKEIQSVDMWSYENRHH